jgi:hypothetical protein
MKILKALITVMVPVFCMVGCQFPRSGPEPVTAGGAVLGEPDWIRNAEPIQFEGENWYPTDEVESLLENEIYQAGVYRGVIFYLDRTDVKPFDRLYTRFLKNRFRAYEKRE